MVGEGVEKKLYDAASTGDLPTFQQLLQGAPYLLDGVSFAGSRNLLHIATIWRRAAIVEEVLEINPRLARNLDSEKSSPLHIAAAEGYTEIGTRLSSVAPEMCWRRDCHGMNPIHIAAMNGKVEILEQLIGVNPIPAREKVGSGDTVMHLCVKHHQLEALKSLADKLGDLVHSKNDDGETILHLAARYDDVEMIKWLVDNTTLDGHEKDSGGRTAVEIIERSQDSRERTEVEIIERSQDSRERTAVEIIESSQDSSSLSDIIKLLKGRRDLAKQAEQFLDKISDAIIVVTVLIATIAFQATMSPPGGVWQEDSSTHKAGEAVMATTHPKIYKSFAYSNTLAFIFSFWTIVLLITRRSIRHSQFQVETFIQFTVVSSMVCVSVSYIQSLKVITPNKHKSISNNVQILVAVSLYFLGMLLLFCFDKFEMGRNRAVNEPSRAE